jgi:polyphosphate kinase
VEHAHRQSWRQACFLKDGQLFKSIAFKITLDKDPGLKNEQERELLQNVVKERLWGQSYTSDLRLTVSGTGEVIYQTRDHRQTEARNEMMCHMKGLLGFKENGRFHDLKSNLS